MPKFGEILHVVPICTKHCLEKRATVFHIDILARQHMVGVIWTSTYCIAYAGACLQVSRNISCNITRARVRSVEPPSSNGLSCGRSDTRHSYRLCVYSVYAHLGQHDLLRGYECRCRYRYTVGYMNMHEALVQHCGASRQVDGHIRRAPVVDHSRYHNGFYRVDLFAYICIHTAALLFPVPLRHFARRRPHHPVSDGSSKLLVRLVERRAVA